MNLSDIRRCLHASVVLLILASACPAVTAGPRDTEARILKVLTWPDYIDPELVARYEQLYDARIEFTYFETDEHRDEILIEQEGRGFDAVLVSSIGLPGYVRQGWLKPLDRSLIANDPVVDATCSKVDSELADYFVPYFWGTVGIAYRSDLVKTPPSSWKELYAPAEEQRGRIMMIGDATDLLGMAVISQGHALSTESTQVWQAAAQLALAQKPFVKRYGYTSLTESAEIVASDNIHMTQIYSGDALTLKDFNENIEYVQPEEGAGIWVDVWAVPSSSSRDRLSHAFLDLISQPEQAAANAEYIYLATCNADAKAFLSTEFLSEQIIYPPDEVLEKLQYYPVHPPRVAAKINAFYSQVVDGR